MTATRRTSGTTAQLRWLHRPSAAWIRRVLVTLLLVCYGLAAAQECTYESEPNDEVSSATRVTGAGPSSLAPAVFNQVTPSCISGSLTGGDTDHYSWTPSDVEAGHRWVIDLEGQPGQDVAVKLISVTMADGGHDVVAATDLLGLATEDGHGVTSREFLINRGTVYALRFTGGAGSYVAGLRPVTALRYGVEDERFEEFSASRALEAPLAAHAVVDGELRQTFTVPSATSGFEWDVELWAALGPLVRFELSGASGAIASGTVDHDGYASARDLSLAPGTYSLTLTGAQGSQATVRYSVAVAGRVLSGTAVEPNDTWADAGLIRPGETVAGTLSGVDYFRLEVADDQAATAWDVLLDSEQDVRLAFKDRWGRELRESRPADALGLTLSPGAYRVLVEGPAAAQYRLSVTPAVNVGGDLEPNDTELVATPLAPNGTVFGEFTGRDTDTFSLTVAGEASVYGFRLESSGSEALWLLDTQGTTVAETRGTGTLRLDDLLLMPGVHYLAVRGSDAHYQLVAVPLTLTPPAGILEIEPNDDVSRAIRLQPGATHVGRLTGGSDDYYRFHLADDQYVRLDVVPPPGSTGVRAYVDNLGWSEPFDDGSGIVTVVERHFLAGDHTVLLRGAAQESDGYYRLSMTQLGVLLPAADAEPNDTREQAGLLPAELSFTGRVGQNSGDYDMFRLPIFTAPTSVSVTVAGATGNFSLDFPSDAAITVSQRGNIETGQPWVAELPAAANVWLRLSGSTAYRLTVAFGAEPDTNQLLQPRGREQLSVNLSASTDRVAAFWHQGQTVGLTASVHNSGATTQNVAVNAASSYASVAVDGVTSVSVGPGQTVEVPLTATVPANLRDDLPLRLEVAVTSAVDAATSAVTLAAYCEAPPVAPGTYWPLSPDLLGRPNALWSGFGVVPSEDSGSVNRDRALVDGRTGPATAGYLGPDSQPTFRLAGDAPVTLLATILNPQIGGDVGAQLRAFRVETSLDGTNFTTAFEGRLKAARIEQVFEFEKPVTARYARLVGIDNHDARNASYLGEWKLIAAELPLGPFNIADPGVGGHVVWSVPFVAAHGVPLLTAGDSPRTVDIREDLRFEFVVGFHNGRAGLIERLEWLDSQGTSPRGEQEQVATVVKVAVSMAGGAGPWQELPDWTLQRDATGRASTALAEATWARYIKFTVEPAEGVRYIYLPDQVSVYETAASADHPSLLGEYGNASRAAVYEYLNPQTGLSAAGSPDAGDSRQEATQLASGASVDGSVTVAEDVDWYRLSIPPGENHIEIRLTGDPQIGYRYELQDAAGSRVDSEERSEGGTVVLTHFGEPGDYFLLIEEPKRTVVFNWDTSGSVGPYEPITYNSLARFAAGVSSEREAVQLLAFNDPDPRWLLPFWSSDTLRVQRAIVEFDRRADSSNSESSLLVATRALADREGTRAILLMTDAESNGENLTPELWRAFGEAMPRIFTFEISSSGTDYAQDLMQDWADVNGGVYTLASGVGDFDAGFSRASCILRRAKGYRVEVTSSYVEPPGPGTLTVTRAPGAALPAVEVIFDASGSMGRELPSGEQRITAAKRALQSLVGEVLPEGTPFALRAFGHIAPSSCETRLDVALAPLDRAKAATVVAAIEPKLLSQTPLAGSLAAVAADLAGATAGRTVILITDGVESCQGDPGAAVTALRGAGLQFDLAIVSLALEPDALASFQTLADSVGASYVDVTSFEELKASIDEALNPAFEVVDASGAVVARGRVGGEGVQLPMGTYTVRVLGAGVEEHTGVRVPGDTLVTLSVGGN